jgi:hypothetical protein
MMAAGDSFFFPPLPLALSTGRNPTTTSTPTTNQTKDTIAKHYPVWVSDEFRVVEETTAVEDYYNPVVTTLLSNIFKTSLNPEFTLASQWNVPTREHYPKKIDFVVLRRLPPKIAKMLFVSEACRFPVLMVELKRPCDLHLGTKRREATSQIEQRYNEVIRSSPFFFVEKFC